MENTDTRVTRAGQTMIYFKKHFRIFIHEKGWKFVLFGGLISFLVAYVIGGKMFVSYENTKSGLFAIISACLWIGIFNSIQEVCKERDIIKHEHMAGMHISSYIFAHMLYQAVISFLQSLIMLVICVIFIDFPSGGIIFGNIYIEYFITMFLIIYSSDMMGLAISSCVKTNNSAMTIMPFVLIIQLVMSGVLFRLSGAVGKIAYLTIGKWGMDGISSIAGLNNLPLSVTLKYPAANQVIKRSIDANYASTSGHLFTTWGMMCLFIVIFAAISIIRLKFIDRE